MINQTEKMKETVGKKKHHILYKPPQYILIGNSTDL